MGFYTPPIDDNISLNNYNSLSKMSQYITNQSIYCKRYSISSNSLQSVDKHVLADEWAEYCKESRRINIEKDVKNTLNI